MRALLLILILAATPAWSLPSGACDAMQSLVGIAMDLRTRGVPAQQAIREYRQTRPSETELAIWKRVVEYAYDAPQSALWGSGRADYLTEFHDQCRTWAVPDA